MPPNMPILTTTATANDRVIADIESQISNIHTIRGTLVRDSLILQTISLPDQASRLAWILEHINNMDTQKIEFLTNQRKNEFAQV